jgi:hypothetical protein
MLIVWFFFLPNSALASIYTPLNFSQVPIVNQSSSAQNIAIKNALQNVLVKMSGSKNILQEPEVQVLLKKSRAYVEATRFIAGDTLTIEVEFNESKLQTWLKRNALPLMSDTRPDTLVWMIVDEPSRSKRFLIDDANTSRYHDMLYQAFDRRGLQVTLPLYDLTDLSQVTEIDIWGQFVDVIFEGSARYSPDYVVALKLYVNQDLNWQLDSFIKTEKILKLGTYTAANEQDAMSNFINDYAEMFAQEYAIDTSLFANNAQIKTLITIDNMRSLTDLARVKAYLQGLNIVERIALDSQVGARSTFRVSLLGQPELLAKIIQQNAQILSLDNETEKLTNINAPASLSRLTRQNEVSIPETIPHLYFNRMP